MAVQVDLTVETQPVGENDLKYSSVLAPLAIIELTHEKYVSHD